MGLLRGAFLAAACCCCCAAAAPSAAATTAAPSSSFAAVAAGASPGAEGSSLLRRPSDASPPPGAGDGPSPFGSRPPPAAAAADSSSGGGEPLVTASAEPAAGGSSSASGNWAQFLSALGPLSPLARNVAGVAAGVPFGGGAQSPAVTPQAQRVPAEWLQRLDRGNPDDPVEPPRIANPEQFVRVQARRGAARSALRADARSAAWPAVLDWLAAAAADDRSRMPAPHACRLRPRRVQGTAFVLGCREFSMVGFNSYTLIEMAARARSTPVPPFFLHARHLLLLPDGTLASLRESGKGRPVDAAEACAARPGPGAPLPQVPYGSWDSDWSANGREERAPAPLSPTDTPSSPHRSAPAHSADSTCSHSLGLSHFAVLLAPHPLTNQPVRPSARPLPQCAPCWTQRRRPGCASSARGPSP